MLKYHSARWQTCKTLFNGLVTRTCLCGCAKIRSSTVSTWRSQTCRHHLTRSLSGLSRDEPLEDPHLGSKRAQLVIMAAQKLADTSMIAFDHGSGTFTITDLGRIAAKFYIRYASIEIFNKEFRPGITEADALVLLCQSTEVSKLPLSTAKYHI